MKSLSVRLAALVAAGIAFVTPTAAYAVTTSIILKHVPFRAVFIDFLGQEAIFV